MNQKTKTTIQLTVKEALQEDVDRSIARIPSKIMEDNDFNSGDIIEITNGQKKAFAKLIRAHTTDNGKDMIRLDGTQRANLGVSIGDKVQINKTELPTAKEITLAPHKDNEVQIRFGGDPGLYFKNRLMSLPVMQNQRVGLEVMGRRLGYVVTKVSPKGAVLVDNETEIKVSETPYTGDLKATGISYEDIGGLENEIALIREMVELPMKHPEVFQKLGVGSPKGVLLTGPPGTGKTLLAKAVANETDSSFFSIAGPEIVSKYYGESEKHLREVFEQAEKNAPSIIFIDEIDSIAPKRGEGTDQTEKRIVAQLLTLMDGLKGRGKVVVMAATNRPDDIDEALRRPGRFDRELRINPPSEKGRKEILKIHTRGMPLEKDVNFEEISNKTMGFTGADLEALCKEAALKAIKPHFNEIQNEDKEISADKLDKIRVNRQNFVDALRMVEPSAMREVLINKPNVHWEDIGGLNEAKEKLRELVELPLIRPELFVEAGIKPSKGILLAGPPGTGKTLLAKAVANESNANFISIKGPELISKWVGESEKRIREIFKKARQVAPCIIFFDEFDSITKSRGFSLSDSTEKVVNQLLTELDGVEELEKVMIIAATNRKDLIDPALLRPGRIDSIVELTVPDKETRLDIFKVHMKNMPIDSTVKISEYVAKTEGWTGAEIEGICRQAGLRAIKRIYKEKKPGKITITNEDFEEGIKKVAQSTDKKDKSEKDNNQNKEHKSNKDK